MNMSSTTNIIRIYSQNVRKNYVLVDSLLESQKDLYDILGALFNVGDAGSAQGLL